MENIEEKKVININLNFKSTKLSTTLYLIFLFLGTLFPSYIVVIGNNSFVFHEFLIIGYKLLPYLIAWHVITHITISFGKDKFIKHKNYIEWILPPMRNEKINISAIIISSFFCLLTMFVCWIFSLPVKWYWIIIYLIVLVRIIMLVIDYYVSKKEG